MLKGEWISFVCSFLFIKPQASPSAPPRKLASSPFVSFSLLHFPFSPLTCAMQYTGRGGWFHIGAAALPDKPGDQRNKRKGKVPFRQVGENPEQKKKQGVNCTLELLKYCLQFRSEVSRDGESGGETPSMAGQSNQNLLKIENPQ